MSTAVNPVAEKHKEQITTAIKKGQTTKQIVSRYRGKYNTFQIAAIKGHINLKNRLRREKRNKK